MSFLLYVLIALAVIVLAIWLSGLWLRRGEDLRTYDHPIDAEASELFHRPGGPSAEHRKAETEIVAAGDGFKGMSRRELLQFTRNFMEEMPAGKSFDCRFVPVDAGGVPAEWVIAPGVDPARRVLYIHGGAFFAGSPNSHRTITSRYSEVAGAAVLAIDYRLTPENPRLDCIEDCRTAYRWILENGPEGSGVASRLYISGDSAGGNLSLALSQWVRDEKLRAPDAVIALSPLTDSTYSSPSIRRNLLTDKMLGPMFGGLLKIPGPLLAWMYTLENRVRPSNPMVSPLHGNLAGLPPTLIQVSQAEMLLDDARRYVNKARSSGTPARIQMWPGLLHVWQIFHPDVPEARDAFERIGSYLALIESGGV
jgi:acetyl esterase/lipase